MTAPERLRHLRNPWWFPDHLSVAPLWRALQGASHYAQGCLLDLGCGNAPYRPWFEPRTTRYVTADYPPVAAGVQVACNSESIPFASQTFDTLLCTQVLEHLPHPWLAAGEMARVLKPGGRLILSCPQYWCLHEIPHDYFRFTPYGLRVLFPERDWEWLEHRQQGSTWAVIACALWHSSTRFGRGKKLLSLVLNPLLLLLDQVWQNPRDTTNHLVVLGRKASPAAAPGPGPSDTRETTAAR
jgi:SAM-dependent methyltransferase